MILPRRIQSVRLCTRTFFATSRLADPEGSGKHSSWFENLHDGIFPEKVARLRKLRHCELARRSSLSGVRLPLFSASSRALLDLLTSPTVPDAISCTSTRLSRVPKAPPSLLPLRDATLRTREQCVRARGCARADTLVSIRGGRVRVYMRVYMRNAPLRARCTVASTHAEAPAR